MPSKINHLTEDSFIFKIKTFFYKGLGETFAVDAEFVKAVDKCWGEQKGMATDWRNR